MSLSEAAGSGDRRRALEELRATLALAIESSESGRDIAALSRQLTDVLAQIDELTPAEPKGNQLDELAQRRRRSGAAG